MDPVELIAGETLTLNCTALVEFNTGLEIHWSYPGKLVHPGSMLDKHRTRGLEIRFSASFLVTRETAAWKRSPTARLCLMPRKWPAS